MAKVEDRIEALLEQAGRQCAGRGAQLTPLRRQVLRLVLEAEQPVGAYALLDRLKGERGPAAPPTVYRALDFLLEQGLVHRLERLNAFLPCVGEHGHAHAHQFLICTGCGVTNEISDAATAHALTDAATRRDFAPARMTVEVEGLCGRCRKEPSAIAS
jgi:Fur family zinc uptake transcriptional regulator